jgi:hypothetical protein
MQLGLTIRIGAEGFTLSAPEGRIDLRQLTTEQLGTLASMLSETMGLVQPTAPIRRRRRSNNRKG